MKPLCTIEKKTNLTLQAILQTPVAQWIARLPEATRSTADSSYRHIDTSMTTRSLFSEGMSEAAHQDDAFDDSVSVEPGVGLLRWQDVTPYVSKSHDYVNHIFKKS
jgi:hypothetical protein